MAGGARPPGCGGVARVVFVAVGREKFGEETADQGAEEGQTGADDGDVAFRGRPVGGADVAP